MKRRMVYLLIHTRCNNSWFFDSETLCSHLDSDPYIVCLQLAIGAAHPSTTKVEVQLFGHDMGWEIPVEAILVSYHMHILFFTPGSTGTINLYR